MQGVQEVTCIATDADFTLMHYLNPIKEGAFNVLRRRGASEAEINLAFVEAERRGFSIELMLKFVTGGGKFADWNMEEIKDEYEEWFNSSFAAYEDSHRFLLRYWGRKPIAIVTHGDQNFQRKKIYRAHFPYDELHVTTPPKRKIEVLRDLFNRYGGPIAFIDDKPEEVDTAWHRLGSDNVITFLMGRPDGIYKDRQARYSHIKVVSLREVAFILDKGMPEEEVKP